MPFRRIIERGKVGRGGTETQNTVIGATYRQLKTLNRTSTKLCGGLGAGQDRRMCLGGDRRENIGARRGPTPPRTKRQSAGGAGGALVEKQPNGDGGGNTRSPPLRANEWPNRAPSTWRASGQDGCIIGSAARGERAHRLTAPGHRHLLAIVLGRCV